MSVYPPDLEQYVQAKVASGRFHSRDEFAVEAARLYQDIEARHERLKSDVETAIIECDQGNSEPWDIEEIKRELIQEIGISNSPR